MSFEFKKPEGNKDVPEDSVGDTCSRLCELDVEVLVKIFRHLMVKYYTFQFKLKLNIVS